MPSMTYPWPDGKRAALCVTFDMDAEAAVLAVDEKFSRRPSIMSHQQYGPVTGVPRLLELLEDLELSASFFIPGFSAERPPATVAAIAEAGHEICHHGYLHRPPGLIDAATERSELELGLAALERLAGVRATVFRAPWWETSTATFDLLIEYGFTCDSSLFDRDVPYRLGIGSSEIVEVPVSWALDDWEKYAFLPDPPTGSGVIESPARVHEMWWEEIESYLEVGGCCVLTMHPFLSGRPSRVRALRGLLERAATVSDLWIATVGEVAAHCAGAEGPVHPLALPTVDSGPAQPVRGS
ncbi:MAG TPA: polysaccharide deacetylase [Actinobacteria bacterium]|nr:polysaccharide deacetylase [Actinomycetota bacterium]